MQEEVGLSRTTKNWQTPIYCLGRINCAGDNRNAHEEAMSRASGVRS